MRIGVDFHVTQGIFQGTRTYLRNLYRLIPDLDTNNEYVFFVKELCGVDAEWLKRGKVVAYGSGSAVRRLSYGAATLGRRERLELFHFQYVSPLWCPCPVILSVHDILFETHPEYFRKSFVVRSKVFIRRSAKTASHILTGSEYCKSMIAELYGIPAGTISVIPCGVDGKVFCPEGRRESIELVKRWWGLEDFILTVGRLDARKNHAGLIRAFSIFAGRRMDMPPLVIVGERGFGYSEIVKEIRRRGVEGWVRVIEDVEDEWLPHFYRAAILFVYPSVAEGFGLPPLEAMACGRPVICSNSTSMPEVAGNAALLVDPKDEEELAHKMQLVLHSAELRDELGKRGRAQAEKFSWGNSARMMLDAFEKVV